MVLITYEEVYRTDEFNVISLAGTGRLVFEVAYDIKVDAIKKGLEDEQRKRARQHCKEAMIKMLHDAIEKLEGGEE